MTTSVKPTTREARRLQTRSRILGAATAEFKRCGMAGADIGAIVAAAGVAHGTFFFHFPTKEHVVLELESREEARIAAELARFLETPRDIATTLAKTTELVISVEGRLGNLLFKDVLALHFSPSRPQGEAWTDHPVIVALVKEIDRARQDGETHPDVDPFCSAVFFLLSVYGVLSTTPGQAACTTMLRELVATAVRSLEAR
ncbi:TetR family transcriptional regulator [Mycolicibacterium agri]|uniref:TetR family transcriptional regulator n=1 Tax=Mycolicibacterium agri TaxID=36811 RepID=A0A2A7MQ79_MYCAG|nr:TetR/AcrR family transcriptional regulator [Mycolicibacterium agri]PEG33700.1 TetR family transcriptional regulator [Mycolicibacterium agri]GFG51322.1 TetR family transcriptional regulator [Mycolicibacterium agri]